MLLSEVPIQSTRDRLLLLRSIENFDSVEDEGLITLAEHSRYAAYRDGELLHRQGEPIDRVMIVLEGELDVSRDGEHFTTVTRGFGFGILPLIAGRSPGQARAKGSVTVLEIPARVVLDVYEENFSFVRNTLRLMTGFILRTRGSLPVRPGLAQAEPDPGQYREDPYTFVEMIMSAQQGFFADHNTDAIIQAVRGFHEIRFQPGDVLWEVGDPAQFSLRIDYGIVGCSNPEGQSVRVGGGFTLGVMEPLAGVARTYRAEAETEVIAIRQSIANFLALLETHHDIARQMLANLAGTVLDRA